MIYGYFGIIGSGKTLGAVIQAYKDYKQGEKIFSTMPVNFPHKPIKTVEDFLNCKSGTLLADELWFIIDSRYSHSARNNILSAILLRSRKQMLNIIYTEQHFTQIDTRIRNNTQFFCQSEVEPYFSRLKTARKFLKKGGHFFLNQTFCDRDGQLIDKRFYSNVERFFCLFDTDKDPYIIDIMDIQKKVEKYESKVKTEVTN